LQFQQYNKNILPDSLFFYFNYNSFYLYAIDIKVFFNTTVPEPLLKQLKILAIELGKPQNELLEETIKDILKKHGKKVK
jgi:hypothetical protein